MLPQDRDPTTHEKSNVRSKKIFISPALEQTVVYWQLFAGDMIISRPIKT